VRRFIAVVGLTCALAAGCGGGSGSGGTNPPPPPPTPTPTPSVQTAPVAVSVAIPARAGSAKARAPRYVSPATQVVQIAVNGGAPQTFNAGTGQACSSPPPNSSCSVYSVQAPVGTDTFVISLLDGSNHVLSSGSTQQTIVANQTNTLNVVFNGVVASLRVTVSNTAPPSGSAGYFPVTLQAFDAAGFTIIGAPGALPPITVTDSDASGATGLYLAGSDGTCATQAAPPAHSVTTTTTTANGNSYYTNVCLAYGGQTIPAATLTASTTGVPSATATFAPAAPASPSGRSGAWIGGRDANGNVALERFDASLAPQAEITGASTQLANPTGGGIAGMTVDGSNDVYALVANAANATAAINEYAPASNGNVGPSSSTSFGYASGLSAMYLALDGQGGAYVAVEAAPYCSGGVVRVPLSGGSATATSVITSDCTTYGGNITQLVTDGQGYLYVGFGPTTHNTTVGIARYAIGSGGSVTLDAVLTGVDPFFTVDRNGNVFAGGDAGSPLVEYPAGTFVHGQRVQPSAPSDSWPAGYPAGIDGTGDIFSAKPSASGSVIVFPAGSHTASATASFSASFIAGLFGTPPGGGSGISAQPQSVETQTSATITVSESGYTGTFSELDDCGAIATITPSSANGPSATFTVTSKQTSGGTCTVTFSDAQHNTASVHVGITVVNLTGSSKSRKPH
jgi:hypothetical protein